MSTPNGASPFSLAVMSEQARATQSVLDAPDVIHEVRGVVARKDVFVADARAHSDRHVAERVCRRDVGLGVTDYHRGVVRGHGLADQARLLKCRITARSRVFNRLEE